MTKATVTTALRVRNAPRIAPETLIGVLPEGAILDVDDIITAGEMEWASYPLKAGDILVGKGYSAAQYLNFERQIPPHSNFGVRVGINALNRHEEVCYAAAEKGCRFFMIFNNPGFASVLKDRYPDATVMARMYWDRHTPTIEGAIAKMGGCHDARLIYTGLNEGDEVGQGTVEQIRQRAEFDLALARRIKEISGATYAAGTFSMGTPDFTKPQICSAIRALYAPAYNAGQIWWDHHLYSPRLDHIYQDGELQWYETRWQFLFTQCGFDPDSASRVICSETGEDEGGLGGFASHGRSGDDVAAWCRRFIEVQSRPLVVGGVSHPSPFVGGALFQAGNREDWMGYNVERYYDKLSAVWTSTTRRIVSNERSAPRSAPSTREHKNAVEMPKG